MKTKYTLTYNIPATPHQRLSKQIHHNLSSNLLNNWILFLTTRKTGVKYSYKVQ